MLKTGAQIYRTSSFHSSALTRSQRAGLQSRKLTKSLQPKDSRSGHLEVASRPTFTRDDAPHSGKSPVSERRPPANRTFGSERRYRDTDSSRSHVGERRTGRGGYAPSSRASGDSNWGRSRAAPDPRQEPSSRRNQDRAENHETPSHNVQHERGVSKPRQATTMQMEVQHSDEFYRPHQPVTTASSAKGKGKALSSDDQFHTQFTSPPILPGILRSLKEALGPDARPTPIQSLSMKWLLENPADATNVTEESTWRQFLLAAETGSGKSIAYLLPVLQNIKLAELAQDGAPPPSNRPHNPRGLILAPTHELARQLSGFAKSLLHETKLRVLCASQSNVKSTQKRKDATSSKMATMFRTTADASGEFQVGKGSHPVDLLVGTPMKLLEMVRGRGWDRKEMPEEQEAEEDVEDEEHSRKPRRGRDKMIGFGTWRSKPELGLANVEWVVVDEADVLFDPDFQETTRALLADISEARGHPIPVIPASALQSAQNSTSIHAPNTPEPINYPFNFLLTSATIPNSLNQYLEKHHPSLVRLASPHLHHLPKTLQTEYVDWTGGNKFADIMRRIRRIWAEDAATTATGNLSKVLIFCNKSAKVVELSAYLAEQGIKSVAMTSQSEHRGRGSNRHLEGFLRKRVANDDTETQSARPSAPTSSNDVKNDAHVMVTTSLLSRGLDFSPDIKHVFIVDEPRNMVDFLHRAGRSGRAGQRGKVVVFGKMSGRGSQRGKDARKRVGALVA